MGLFGTLTNRSVTTSNKSQEMPERLRRQLPARFEAIGEALVAGAEVHAACAVVGRDLARDGIDLSEALHGLRSTFDLVVRREPDFESTEALSVAWSDETLSFLHQVSCENPLTGLATLAHVRTRVAEVLRAAEESTTAVEHVLIVIDQPADLRDIAGMGRALAMARLADRARLVFAGSETIGEAGPSRLLVLAERSETLGNRVAVLRDLISGSTPIGDLPARVWIEGLPDNHAASVALLDELART
ncbi:hypothetical protein [Marmoricola sp. RAF53]|uniref:hypothetical protein n=1 Tax=Marmoricola sp. RAF53 TaxID=3233059 RepID=UPI003F9D1A3A